MFTFQMRLADGTPADPPRFRSAVPNWGMGDKVMVGATPRYVITATEYDAEDDVTTWVVAPVPNSH